MSIVNDDSFHWVVTRSGILGVAGLITINAITIVILALVVSGAPDAGSQNFLSLVVGKLDAFLFFFAFLLMAAAGVCWLFGALRVPIRILLPWFVICFFVSGLGWWVIHILESRFSLAQLP